jgi:hypothetical protein
LTGEPHSDKILAQMSDPPPFLPIPGWGGAGKGPSFRGRFKEKSTASSGQYQQLHVLRKREKKDTMSK